METSLTENQVRKLARRNGCLVRKSRRRTISSDNLGEYMLIDGYRGDVITGSRYDASLQEVASYFEWTARL